MVSLIVFLIAAVVGFTGSRVMRRSSAAGPVPSAVSRPERERARPDRDRPLRSDRSRSAPLPNARRGLTAPELERAALVAALGAVRLGGDGLPAVPEQIVLLLHPDDSRLLDDQFESRIAAAVGAIATEQRWRLGRAVTIRRRPDPSRRPGLPTIEDPSHAADVATASTALVLRRSDDGTVHRLSDAEVTIGRGDDRVITVDDHRVSRDHARIEPRGSRWLLTDSGSANGTFVDGHRLPSGRSFALIAGATIGVGPVEFRVDSAEASPRPVGGSPALPEPERIELARIHLPDGGKSRK